MSAILSDCGTYRYRLDREVSGGGGKGVVLFVMLNPSTADAEVDDPTIRRCVGFARAWGYDRLEVVNLFAYRATDPRELARLPLDTAMGPDNPRHTLAAVASAALVVAAWGASYPRALADYVGASAKVLRRRHVHHLGLTKGGDPRHPLYLRGDARPVMWAP